MTLARSRPDGPAIPATPGARGRAARPPLPDGPSDLAPERPPLSLPLFDPAGLLRLLVAVTAPFAWTRLLVVPAALAALFAAGFHRHDLLDHADRMATGISLFQQLAFGLLTANLLGKGAQAVSMARQGAPPRAFGIRLAFGILPRFYIDVAPLRWLPLRGQRTCHAAPLLMRLALFAGGILTWDATRRSGSGLADLAVVLAGIGLTSFLITANPVWPADGYRWLAAALERPRLRPNAMRVLGLVLRARGLPPDLPRSEFWLLLLYAAASLVATAAIIFVVVAAAGYALEARFRGTGVVIFCLLLAAVAMFLLDMRRRRRVPARRRERADPATARVAPARAAPGRRVTAIPVGRDDGGAFADGTDAAPVAGSRDEGSVSHDGGREEDGTMERLARRVGAEGVAAADPAPVPVDDPLESLLADAELWTGAEEPAAPRSRRAEAGPGPDASLDDLLGPAPGPIGPDLDEALAFDDLDDLLAMPEVASAPTPVPAPAAPSRAEAAAPAAPVLPPVERPAEALRSLPEPRAAAASLAPAGPAPRRQQARVETPDLDRLLGVGAARPTRAGRWRTALIWLAVLGVLAWAAVQPYPFEVGGEFVVQPLDRAEVRSRTDGEIIEINVDEGDWVEAGDVLAVLSNWDELRDVAINEADGAKLQADLATLTSGASPQQIAVAEQAVATAELRVEALGRQLEREQALFDTGTIPESSLEEARASYDLAVSSRDEARASLDVVRAPARPTQIDSLEAAIARNEEEVAFSRLLLEYTNIRAPVSGQVVSSLDEVPLGAFLTTGGLFAELEDNRAVIAEVEVPETTIAEVEVGALAELRLWSDPETPIRGEVRSIAPRAEERDFGWIIRVQVEVPNADGRLAANMTGFGKISAEERPAWRAFTRAIERFFVIELWSWLP